MTNHIPLTQLAHSLIGQVLKPGEVAIDATAGNGFDAKFLVDTVGSDGVVFAIDIQQLALSNTQAIAPAAIAIHGNHADLVSLIPAHYHGRISAVVFNLGYLPRGDKAIRTDASTTELGIQSALSLLNDRGCLSVLAYTGHEGGAEENELVARLMHDAANTKRSTLQIFPEIPRPGQPVLYHLRFVAVSFENDSLQIRARM